MRAAADNAMELATRLSNHAAVSAVLYPGLPHHPGHAVARRQMKGGFGGMLSIRVRGGAEAAVAAAARVSLWKRATSLGGVESLIEHRASIEGAGSPCPPDLLRLSAGVEDIEDLWRDIDRGARGVGRASLLPLGRRLPIGQRGAAPKGRVRQSVLAIKSRRIRGATRLRKVAFYR